MLPASVSKVSRNHKSKVSSNKKPATPSSSSGFNQQNDVGCNTSNSCFILQPKPLIHDQIEILDAQKLDAAYFNKHDISANFLDSVETLTRRDFEHATIEDALNHAAAYSRAKMDRNNNVGDRVPLKRFPSPANENKVENVDGYLFFGSSPRPRPLSAPFSNTRKFIERHNISRPLTGMPGNGLTPRALTRTKVFPSNSKPIHRRPGTAKLVHSRESSRSDTNIAVAFNREDDRPNTTPSSKRVTFAADVVNYERENKPSKRRKMPKRKKQGFAHPSRGIFVPPEWEIMDCEGPAEQSCRQNPYLNFTQVWTHPSNRDTTDNNGGLVVRKERFHRVMTDLEHAHHHYNRLTQTDQDVYLIHNIFKRYILALDLALTEGNMPHVEHILDTIENSTSVLQRSLHNRFFASSPANSELDEENLEMVPPDNPDLVLVNYALNKISSNAPRQDMDQMSIETLLVKLCFEMISVVFAPMTCGLFRVGLSLIPFTAKRASQLLKEAKNDPDKCYIMWINNSAAQRDFRSVLKNYSLLDKYGCKAEINEAKLPSFRDLGQKRSGPVGVKRREPSSPRAPRQRPKSTPNPE